jgi:hypothetical protein
MGAGPDSSPLSPGTNAAPPIRIEPLADEAAGAKWREQQLAKQAAEQKARDEAREKLRRALYKFLLHEEEVPDK